MQYLISCDWFQYCCINQYSFLPKMKTRLITDDVDSNGEVIVYDVVAPKEFHPIYKDSLTLQYKGEDIVHCHYNPQSLNIQQNYVAVKVANRLLYNGRWAYFLHSAIRALRLTVNNITRLDLCLDFQKFANDVTPHDFMHTYLADSLRGEQTYIRKHSNQFTVVANKTMKSDSHPVGTTYAADYQKIELGKNKKPIEVGFKHGETLHSCTPHFQTIRWGNRQSAVMVEMYNKSKELRDKHHKPYISECWQECGIIASEDLPVYRIEISITSKGLGYQRFSSVKTSEKVLPDTFEKLSVNDLCTQEKLESVFWSYAAEYFCFYEFRGTCKWRKDMPKAQLFDRECLEQAWLKPKTINRSHDTGRSERLAASTFERLAHTLVDMDIHDVHAFNLVARKLANIAALKNARHLRKSKEEQRYQYSDAYYQFKEELERRIESFGYDKDYNRTDGSYNDLITDALPESFDAKAFEEERWQSLAAMSRYYAAELDSLTEFDAPLEMGGGNLLEINDIDISEFDPENEGSRYVSPPPINTQGGALLEPSVTNGSYTPPEEEGGTT